MRYHKSNSQDIHWRNELKISLLDTTSMLIHRTMSLLEIINNVLEASLIESKSIDINIEKINVNEIINEAIDMNRYSAISNVK